MAPCPPTPLEGVFASLLARRESRGVLRRLTVPDSRLVDFSSNDYLSLARHPDMTRAYVDAVQALRGSGDGAFALGSGGSRLLDGNSERAEGLERSLAQFHGAPAALLFNSGYEANTGLLSSVPQAGDVVVFDEAIHASMHAGLGASRAGRRLAFRHNGVWDDDDAAPSPHPVSAAGATRPRARLLPALEGVLRALAAGRDGPRLRAGHRHVLVAVEAVYSMDGDVAPLQGIVDCVDKYLPAGSGLVIVDEAHSNGVLGARGRGLVCQLGLERRVWARVLTFGKAMGCSGAAVLCSALTRAYLINYARSFIYTTAMGLPGLLSMQCAHRFVATGQADALRRTLRARTARVGGRLRALCRRHDAAAAAAVLRIAAGDDDDDDDNDNNAQSPILPLFTSRAKSLAAHCQRRGFLVRAIVAPTVPRGTDRVRVCVHAGNSEAECDGLCDAVEEWLLAQAGAAAAGAEDKDTDTDTDHHGLHEVAARREGEGGAREGARHKL